MSNALVGYSGFVGTTLLRQTAFEDLYRSTNIHEIRGKHFETVICAAAPAQKWIANQDPDADRLKIEGLMEHLRTITSKSFVLISTVDVFKTPIEVDETSPVDKEGLHAYGLHRLMLEEFVQSQFENHLVVRLPGLVGPALRKNVIFDFLNDNNLAAIDSRGVFQFYPMVNLWYDIKLALAANLGLVHLTAEPISVADVASLGFGKFFENAMGASVARYDFRTRYASVFGSEGRYQYDRRATLQAIRAYAQAEQLTRKHEDKS